MKVKIAIANTLKPVDDVRAFEKIAQSLAKTNKYEVNIIGNSPKKESTFSNIQFAPHTLNRKSILKRFLIRFKILGSLLKIQPQIIIIQTHELLLVGLCLKLIRNSKLVYDVREDYARNIKYLSKLPFLIRMILAYTVRLKEQLAIYFIDQIWFAEDCYTKDIGFKSKHSIVLENKANYLNRKRVSQGKTMLFTGTISNYSGIRKAIEIFQSARESLSHLELRIVGQCHDEHLIEELKKYDQGESGISLTVSNNPIPHEDILESIFEADIGIISYLPNPVNHNKVPTKLYEYSQYGLPYLIQENTYWSEKARMLGGSIPIDFNNPNSVQIVKSLEKMQSAVNDVSSRSNSWETQESILIDSIERLLI